MTPETPILTRLPEAESNASACAAILLDGLADHPGFVSADFDAASTRLVLRYNTQAITASTVGAVADQLSRNLGFHLEACHVHHEAGPRCTACSVALTNLVSLNTAAKTDIKGERISIRLAPDPAPATVGRLEITLRPAATARPSVLPRDEEDGVRPLALATVLCVAGLVGGYVAEVLQAPGWVGIALFLFAIVSGGWFPVIEGIASLRQSVLDINFLMIAGAAGAAFLGKWSEGATLMFLFSLSGTLESYAVGRTRHAIRKLMDLSPESALVRRGDQEVRVPVSELRLGDHILVYPGERIAADGEIVQGESAVNEAAITGESMPVEKAPGVAVFAGTVNGQGVLEIQVSRLASESTLARIIRYVEEAQAQKATTQRLTDWIDRYYTLAVVGIALLAWVIPPLFLGDTWQSAFYRAMMLLVVASPCAIVISTPAAILSAIARAARSGILFKGGVHLEQAARVRVLAFDKTGTLTTGQPRVVAVQPAAGMDDIGLLRLAAAAESRSEHPLAAAVLRHAREQHVDFPRAENFQAITGQGGVAQVGGQEVWVGSLRLLDRWGIPADDPIRAWADQEASQGHTTMFVYSEHLLGAISLADTPRAGAREALAAVKALGIKRTVMLTGDNPRAANSVARLVGVDEVRAGLLPQDKLQVIHDLEARYGPVGMVGDGVNDAPALAAATVGVAMGGIGSDVAMETADVVLMADDLGKLPEAIDISRRARRTVIQNLAFALTVITTLITLVLLDKMTLTYAVMGHEGSTILVAFNGLRLLLPRRLRKA